MTDQPRTTVDDLRRSIGEINEMKPKQLDGSANTLATRQQAGIRLSLETIAELLLRVEDLERRLDEKAP